MPATVTATATMTSVVQSRFGADPEEVLGVAEVPVPTPGEGEVLVRVRAASVDRGTWHVLAGEPYAIRLAGFGLRRPRAANPGRALAGTVAAVGAGVEGFAVGDEVFGVGTATFAEYALARPAKLAPRPVGLPAEDAAALAISGLTALQAVRDRARVQAGERVLVLGASGGVGSLAVAIAVAAGAHVTGTARTAKLDAVRSLGAADVLDHTREDVTGTFDVVLDTGGNRPLGELRRLLTPRGRLVIVGGEDAGRWLGVRRQLRAQALSPFVRQSLGTFITSENTADLRALGDLGVRPLLDRRYPLEGTAAAIRRMLDGQATGKVVVAVG